MMKLSKGEKYSVLRYAVDSLYSSHKVRAMVASKHFTDSRYAVAFVIKSLANRLSAHFYIKFYKPATPFRIFNDEATALEWLKGQEKLQYPVGK